jgi:hypothetical protein
MRASLSAVDDRRVFQQVKRPAARCARKIIIAMGQHLCRACRGAGRTLHPCLYQVKTQELLWRKVFLFLVSLIPKSVFSNYLRPAIVINKDKNRDNILFTFYCTRIGVRTVKGIKYGLYNICITLILPYGIGRRTTLY